MEIPGWRTYNRRLAGDQMTARPGSSKNPWYLLLTFGCLSLGILLIGYIYYQHQVAHIKQDKQNDLAAIMELKTQQIINWRQERLGDATVIMKDRLLALRISGQDEVELSYPAERRACDSYTKKLVAEEV